MSFKESCWSIVAWSWRQALRAFHIVFWVLNLKIFELLSWLRVWHVAVPAVLVALMFWNRSPGGRDFDGDDVPFPSPISEIDAPENVLNTLISDFDSSARPLQSPVVLHLARACDAVYASGETSVPRLFYELKFDRVIPVPDGANFATVGIKDDIAVIVFRGTDEIKDWYTNLSVEWEPVADGRLHSGFWFAYRSLKKKIVEQIDAQEIKHLWICGHSLGGAMALCCAYDLKATTQLPISGVITFGQPKLADSPLAKHINTILAKKYLAVVADEDPVADTVPLCNFCGNSIWFYDGRIPRYDGESEGALMSSSPGSENVSAAQADEPYFEEVMTVEELRQKQEMLREQDEPQIRNPNDPPVMMSSLPFFRDHNMTNYIDKLRNYFSGNSR